MDLGGAQLGDSSIGQVAETIYQGLSPEHVAGVLDREISFRNEILKAYERDNREIRARFDQQARDTELYRELERDAREKRQQENDQSQRALARELHQLRVWLIALTVALVVGFVLLTWLLYDRYTAAAVARLWVGGGLALALALARR